MNKIEFIDRSDFDRVWEYCKVTLKMVKHDTRPPKEYKASPYKAWSVFHFFGNKFTGVLNGWTIYFRDEQDYLMALLMK